MPIPDYETLMLPVLKRATNGETKVSKILDGIAAEFSLTPEERSELLPSGSTTVLASRAHWAKTYMKRAGLLEQPRRGWFQITQRGREVLASNPARIDNKVLMQFPEFRDFRTSGRTRSSEAGDDAAEVPQVVGIPAALDPEEAIAASHRSLEALLAEELSQRMAQLSPAAFERLIVELMTAMGYGGSRREAARALGGSGDDGVDGVIDEDALGLDRIYIQAKRYQPGSRVGAGAVRDFYGGLDLKKASKGLFVTTASFTEDARRTAEQFGKRIVLVDGVALAELMIRHGVGCRDVQTFAIKRIDEDFFEELDE